jgi:FtsH-binding integral membrane protein
MAFSLLNKRVFSLGAQMHFVPKRTFATAGKLFAPAAIGASKAPKGLFSNNKSNQTQLVLSGAKKLNLNFSEKEFKAFWFANTAAVGFLSARGMAFTRRRRRTVATQEEEQTQQQNQTMQPYEQQQQTSQPYQQEQQQQQQEPEYAEGMTTGELLTPQVQAYVSKVYRFMAGMTGASIAGGVIGAAVGFPPLIGFLGGLGCLLGVMFTSREKVRLREWLGYGFGALQGLSVGMFVSLFSPGVIAAAALGTLALFGGFSLAALRADRAAYIKYGGIMFGALIFLVLAGLGGMLASAMGWASAGFLKALYNINLWFGLGLFSLFISFDTQRMIDSAYQGVTDHVSDALNMFMNLFNIFIRLLQIFGGRDE